MHSLLLIISLFIISGGDTDPPESPNPPVVEIAWWEGGDIGQNPNDDNPPEFIASVEDELEPKGMDDDISDTPPPSKVNYTFDNWQIVVLFLASVVLLMVGFNIYKAWRRGSY